MKAVSTAGLSLKRANSSRAMAGLSLANLLFNRQPPSPPLGIGRIHRLADDDTQLPDEIYRFREYVAAVGAGADTAGAIRKLLSFDIDAPTLKADLRELLRRGGISTRKRNGVVKFIAIPDRGAPK